MVYYLRDDPTALGKAVRAQTAMTHNQSHVVESAAFFAGMVLDVIKGGYP
ncbi:MAG: ADP-ribosylglycohydrolase family protein [Deltaproteobacteria bacterium]|nr:ADP-ribosylglycohydrolase family protein [Deltaproteobacteria bacterium]